MRNLCQKILVWPVINVLQNAKGIEGIIATTKVITRPAAMKTEGIIRIIGTTGEMEEEEETTIGERPQIMEWLLTQIMMISWTNVWVPVCDRINWTFVVSCYITSSLHRFVVLYIVANFVKQMSGLLYCVTQQISWVNMRSHYPRWSGRSGGSKFLYSRLAL